MPMEPVIMEASSERMSPNMFSVTMTSNCAGFFTICIAQLSTSISVSSTSVYSNLSSTSNLAGLFTELLNSSIMRKTILQETDISSFDGTIDTAVVPNTNLITMTVTDSDPRMAFLAAQAIIEHHESLTYQVIDDIGLEVLQYPAVPTSPTNQNFAFHQMKKAAVIAALAATALLAILSYLRDAVRSGTEAREKLDGSIRLIVLDITLPDGDGVAL